MTKTKTRVIDGQEALELLKYQVEIEGAHYVYTDHFDACLLAVYGKPACIVGRVYADLGVPVNDLERMDDQVGQESFYNEYVDFLDYNLEFTENAKKVLRAAQQQQDDGTTWGNAIKYAENFVEEEGDE